MLIPDKKKMDVDDSTLELCLANALVATNLLSLMHTRNMKKKKKARRHWVKPWMARKSKNVFNNLLKEMCLEDQQAFYDYHRMHRKNFAEFLELVSPAQRLSITLRYLATGESRRSLEFQYRTSHCLISSIIPETCDAIFTSLKNDYLKLPTSSEEWQQVASVFSSVWNFPMCIGALDGKRVLIRKPSNSGSEYFDYKTHHSIIMLALVDANYKFLYVDIGAQGRASDAGVWDKCNLREYLEEKRLQECGREHHVDLRAFKELVGVIAMMLKMSGIT
ncbi:hypothetical protein Pmani_010963 [Petrolisthes manimaculis]|uniref:DDE Tnp4 domain-containing protein n=1 Tax=Petrolisthes manimaculis TaxID=1843537 RepID=A0AAE1Q1N3_9EUCA|nr:hypothetical protein Pmani_010963 [Petrolisthes manimaculis]